MPIRADVEFDADFSELERKFDAFDRKMDRLEADPAFMGGDGGSAFGGGAMGGFVGAAGGMLFDKVLDGMISGMQSFTDQLEKAASRNEVWTAAIENLGEARDEIFDSMLAATENYTEAVNSFADFLRRNTNLAEGAAQIGVQGAGAVGNWLMDTFVTDRDRELAGEVGSTLNALGMMSRFGQVPYTEGPMDLLMRHQALVGNELRTGAVDPSFGIGPFGQGGPRLVPPPGQPFADPIGGVGTGIPMFMLDEEPEEQQDSFSSSFSSLQGFWKRLQTQAASTDRETAENTKRTADAVEAIVVDGVMIKGDHPAVFN